MPDDYQNIRKKVIQAKSSFYLAMLFLPARQKRALFALYAYCRHLDDIADDDKLALREKKEKLKTEALRLESLYGERPFLDNAMMRELYHAIHRYDIRHEDLFAIIEGMKMDMEGGFFDETRLDIYCDCVASAVGRVWLTIFGEHSSHGHAYAHHLGRALQLTNILRDLDEDNDKKRCYLPTPLLQRHDIKMDDTMFSHPQFPKVCEELVKRAESHFDQAHAQEQYLKRRTVRHAAIMADVYRALLRRLKVRGFIRRDKIKLPKVLLLYYLLRRHVRGRVW